MENFENSQKFNKKLIGTSHSMILSHIWSQKNEN